MFRKFTLHLLAIIIVAVPLLATYAGEVSAATSRVTIIKEMKGTVKVKKAGGSKEFTAFAKMSLNEGDILSVGDSSSAILAFSNGTSEDDKMSVAANSTLSFSKLTSKNGTKTKVTMFNGNAWIDVKSIETKDDQFTIETPTAIMGVRGTHLFVGIDPVTGAMKLIVGAGVVSATPSGLNTEDQSQKMTFIYPLQQISIDGDGSDSSSPQVFDIQSFINNVQQPAVLESLLRSMSDINKENELFIERMREKLQGDSSTGQFPSLPDLDPSEVERLQLNLSHLIAAIAKTAIDSKKLTQSQLDSILNEMNKTLDLNKSKLELTEQEKLQIERQRLLELEQLKQAEAQKKKEEELRKKQEALVNQLLEQQKKLEEAKQKAQEEKLKKAQEEYEKQLALAERERFLAAKEQLRKDAAASASPSPSPSNSSSPSPSITPKSQNALLSGLALSSGSISFANDAWTYTVVVNNSVSSLNITPTVADTGKATVKVNGTVASSGSSALISLNAAGVDTIVPIEVTAEDGTTKKTYTITFKRNQIPVVSAASYNTNRNVVLNGVLGAMDPDGDAVTFGKSAEPAHGTVTVFSNGQFTYTPDSNYSGYDSFKVKGYDGREYSAEMEIIINVINVNNAPVAQNSSIYMNKNVTYTETLSVIDLDGDTLTYSVVNAPTHGHLIVNGVVGNFTYTPDANYVGTDTFTFKAYDGQAYSNVATVTVQVVDATLSDLRNLNFELSRAFDPTVLDYTSAVRFGVINGIIMPVKAEVSAMLAVKLNGTTIVGDVDGMYALPFIVGSNLLEVAVTHPEGVTNTYTVTVVREAPASSEVMIQLTSDDVSEQYEFNSSNWIYDFFGQYNHTYRLTPAHHPDSSVKLFVDSAEIKKTIDNGVYGYTVELGQGSKELIFEVTYFDEVQDEVVTDYYLLYLNGPNLPASVMQFEVDFDSDEVGIEIPRPIYVGDGDIQNWIITLRQAYTGSDIAINMNWVPDDEISYAKLYVNGNDGLEFVSDSRWDATKIINEAQGLKNGYNRLVIELYKDEEVVSVFVLWLLMGDTYEDVPFYIENDRDLVSYTINDGIIEILTDGMANGLQLFLKEQESIFELVSIVNTVTLEIPSLTEDEDGYQLGLSTGENWYKVIFNSQDRMNPRIYMIKITK
ncbi:MAG: Ig-like domain-containing protein [Candidatus Cohnella colombiensis]|uniref:Ig-like domain-containing protein n=1 Tax=Candidatus Cohnella colombiensis TaxID=3121368 RepID=A0AA95EVG1_9BACL|nr:MAG: Ig-like domain-containing protein [Cohnella sp.]